MIWLSVVRYVVNRDVLSSNDGKLQAEAVAVLRCGGVRCRTKVRCRRPCKLRFSH